MALQGQVAVITGSAKGVGRYAAHSLAGAGANIVIADIEDAAKMERVAGEVRELGAEALVVNADVRDDGQVKALMDRAASHFGRVDILLNNAAIVTHFQWGVPIWPPVRDMEKSFWDRVIDTNLGGAFACAKHAIPHMARQGGGHIMSVGTAPRGGAPSRTGFCAYAVSKAAVEALTRFVAAEERENNICVLTTHILVAIATEEAPEEAQATMHGPDAVGDLFVLGAQAGMEYSGNSVIVEDGKLQVIPWDTGLTRL